MDYEWTSAKQKQSSESQSATRVGSAEQEKSPNSNPRRSSNAAPAAAAAAAAAAPAAATSSPGQKNANANANAVAPQIPGMSSFSVNPDGAAPPPTQTRKRKAPGTGHHMQTASAIVAQATGPPRKQAMANASSAKRTTNLMTFETCGGYLKNGKLKADDGTTLAVTGKSDTSEDSSPGTPVSS